MTASGRPRYSRWHTSIRYERADFAAPSSSFTRSWVWPYVRGCSQYQKVPTYDLKGCVISQALSCRPRQGSLLVPRVQTMKGAPFRALYSDLALKLMVQNLGLSTRITSNSRPGIGCQHVHFPPSHNGVAPTSSHACPSWHRQWHPAHDNQAA